MKNNPITTSFRNFNLYLMFWLVITVLYVILSALSTNVPINIILIDTFVYNLLLCGLGISFWYTTKFLEFERFKFSTFLSGHIINAIVISIIWLEAGYLIISNLLESSINYDNYFFILLPNRVFNGLLFYFLINSFYYSVIYYKNYQDRLLAETELKNLVAEAELKYLKFQINPHFIFNSLNSISALTGFDPLKAREMIQKLADFLRFTLANNDKQKNSLEEELKNIKRYLEIEKIRFDDKFEFEEMIDDKCKELPIPNMILQPLVENAVKHAVYDSLEKITITFSCNMENNFMVIKLKNNWEANSSNKKGAGVGLTNIKNRLELIYHKNNLLKIEKDDKYFCVIIYIPIKEE